LRPADELPGAKPRRFELVERSLPDFGRRASAKAAGPGRFIAKRRSLSAMTSFETELRKLPSEEVDYASMSEIIDGPYNPPSEKDLESGDFENEYFSSRDILIEALERNGLNMEALHVMDYAVGSRCLGLRIENDENVSLISLVATVMDALSRIHMEFGVDYCASIYFGTLGDIPKPGEYRDASQPWEDWFVGIEKHRIRHCHEQMKQNPPPKDFRPAFRFSRRTRFGLHGTPVCSSAFRRRGWREALRARS
jgi:hypothetical protein